MTEHQCHLSKNSRDSIIYLSQQLSDWEWTREKNTTNKNPFFTLLIILECQRREREKKTNPKIISSGFLTAINHSLELDFSFISIIFAFACIAAEFQFYLRKWMIEKMERRKIASEISLKIKYSNVYWSNFMCTTFSSSSLCVVVAVMIVD